jgi:apolipoprotein N-acyltransferase
MRFKSKSPIMKKAFPSLLGSIFSKDGLVLILLGKALDLISLSRRQAALKLQLSEILRGLAAIILFVLSGLCLVAILVSVLLWWLYVSLLGAGLSTTGAILIILAVIGLLLLTVGLVVSRFVRSLSLRLNSLSDGLSPLSGPLLDVGQAFVRGIMERR